MGIWVRSQNDVRAEINGYNIYQESKSKYEVIGFDVKNDGKNCFILGTYSTYEKAEKATKLLDSIVRNQLCGNFSYFDVLFEMPQDEEV